MRDPYFGLSRSTWNNLILPSKAIRQPAQVDSTVVKSGYSDHGIRLIDFESAKNWYLRIRENGKNKNEKLK